MKLLSFMSKTNWKEIFSFIQPFEYTNPLSYKIYYAEDSRTIKVEAKKGTEIIDLDKDTLSVIWNNALLENPKLKKLKVIL